MLRCLSRTVSVCLASFRGPAKQTCRKLFVSGTDEAGELTLRHEWRCDNLILGGRWGIILSVSHSTITATLDGVLVMDQILLVYQYYLLSSSPQLSEECIVGITSQIKTEVQWDKGLAPG